MKTPFIPKLILLFILFFLYSAGYAQQRDSVTIRGQVTDYNGKININDATALQQKMTA